MAGTGKIGPIVAGSVVSGLLLALLLVLVVFAGETEPVITGSVLLGFAVGWFLLAWLSTKYSEQPQKWAYVPAAYMGIIGVMFLVFRPSGDFIAMSGWVWPPALLALTIWVFVNARRNLNSHTKGWIVYPVLAALVLSALGGGYERIQESVDKSKYPMQGKLVDVGGYRLHIHCQGKGSPTVVLEAGLGAPSVALSGWITPTVSRQTRVCVYDRAGQSWSEDAPRPLDGRQTATALHNLLAGAHITGPLVLAGHSLGGIYALDYAKYYPKEVAGVALLDSMSPYQYEKIPAWAAFYSGFRPVSALMPSLARLGIGRLAFASAGTGLPPDVGNQARAMSASPDMFRSQRDEFSVIRNSLDQAKTLKTLGDKPLYVLTARKEAQQGWLPLQDQLAALSTNSVHQVLPNATHASVVDDKEDAAKSGRAILDVVSSVRTSKL